MSTTDQTDFVTEPESWKDCLTRLWGNKAFGLCFEKKPLDPRHQLLRKLADRHLCALRDEWKKSYNLDDLAVKLGVKRTSLNWAADRGKDFSFKNAWLDLAPRGTNQPPDAILVQLEEELDSFLEKKRKSILSDAKPEPCFIADPHTAKVLVAHKPLAPMIGFQGPSRPEGFGHLTRGEPTIPGAGGSTLHADADVYDNVLEAAPLRHSDGPTYDNSGTLTTTATISPATSSRPATYTVPTTSQIPTLPGDCLGWAVYFIPEQS